MLLFAVPPEEMYSRPPEFTVVLSAVPPFITYMEVELPDRTLPDIVSV